MNGQIIKRCAACIVLVLFVALQRATLRRLSIARRNLDRPTQRWHLGGGRAPDIATRPEIEKASDSELLKVLRDGILQEGMPPFAALGPAKLFELRHR